MDGAGVLVVFIIGFFVLMGCIGHASSGNAPDRCSSAEGLAKKQLWEARRAAQLLEEQGKRERGEK